MENTSPKHSRITKSALRDALFLCCVALIVASGRAQAQSLLPSGNFETGTLYGWTAGGENGGVAQLAQEGTCFSGSDTTSLDLSGSYAALLRSDSAGNKDSVGVLTSDPFTVGDGILFIALSENGDSRPDRNPVNLEVRMIDTAGNILLAQAVKTSIVTLPPGCPLEPRYGAFSGHYISTRAFLGQEVQLQFRQNTNIQGYGFFTLIDDVVLFQPGQAPVFPGQPIAIAGTSQNDVQQRVDGVMQLVTDVIQLDASQSFDPNGDTLTFSWRIDGETSPRDGDFVSVDDLSAGNHTATLIVSDGVNIATDKLLFVVPEQNAGQ